ncbi:N-acetylglutamate synthase OS=Streptomyces glaucescens OX=1907 GN=SGLAU_09595 PE=4 SV=1 [Streptomyces glaucescens]
MGTRTRFAYHEKDGEIWAEYAGGDVVRGHLVRSPGTGDRLDFRYVQLKHDGTTSSGHCVSRVVELPDGRVRLEESWEWESQPGRGTSVVEEIPADVQQVTGDGH